MQENVSNNHPFLQAIYFLLFVPVVLLGVLLFAVLLFVGVILFLPILALLLLTHFAVLIFRNRNDNKGSGSASVKDKEIEPILYARRASHEIN